MIRRFGRQSDGCCGNLVMKLRPMVRRDQMFDRLPDESRPSCILLDVRIPGLTGPELQDRLAERGSLLPIIFLTGHGDIPTSVQAIKAGAEDFLTKPV